MTALLIMVPLMVAAVIIATVPVLYHSVREHRLIHTGSASKPLAPAPVYATRRTPSRSRSA